LPASAQTEFIIAIGWLSFCACFTHIGRLMERHRLGFGQHRIAQPLYKKRFAANLFTQFFG
jgi:hypothetical protein